MNPLNRMNPGADEFKTAQAFVRAVNGAPMTGNGYGVAINPLLEEPATIDEHVSLIRARGASLERWTRKHETIGTSGPIIREIIARMEGDLQGLRTLVKDVEKAESEPTLTPEQNARLAATSAEILARVADAK